LLTAYPQLPSRQNKRSWQSNSPSPRIVNVARGGSAHEGIPRD